MPIIINTEKVWKDGQQCRKVLNFKVLTFDQVPEEYHEAGTGPACWSNITNNKLIVWPVTLRDEYAHIIHKNDIIKEETFQTILKLVRKAGDRLRKINKRLAEERAKLWSGKEKFTI